MAGEFGCLGVSLERLVEVLRTGGGPGKMRIGTLRRLPPDKIKGTKSRADFSAMESRRIDGMAADCHSCLTAVLDLPGL